MSALNSASATTAGVVVIASVGAVLLICVTAVFVFRRRHGVRERRRLDASRRSLELPSFVSVEGMAAEGDPHEGAVELRDGAKKLQPSASVAADGGATPDAQVPTTQTWQTLASTGGGAAAARGTAEGTDWMGVFSSFDLIYAEDGTTATGATAAATGADPIDDE